MAVGARPPRRHHAVVASWGSAPLWHAGTRQRVPRTRSFSDPLIHARSNSFDAVHSRRKRHCIWDCTTCQDAYCILPCGITHSAKEHDPNGSVSVQVRFVGYDASQPAVALEHCGKCKAHQGGFHTYTSNLTFANSGCELMLDAMQVMLQLYCWCCTCFIFTIDVVFLVKPATCMLLIEWTDEVIAWKKQLRMCFRSPRLLDWSWVNQGVFLDVDGTLATSGILGAHNAPSSAAGWTLGSPGVTVHSGVDTDMFRNGECVYLARNAGSAPDATFGVACSPALQFKRVMLNGHSPNTLQTWPLQVTDLAAPRQSAGALVPAQAYRTANVTFSKYNEHGYQILVPTGAGSAVYNVYSITCCRCCHMPQLLYHIPALLSDGGNKIGKLSVASRKALVELF